MRTRKFFQKTSKKITINGNDTAGYDKSKLECFNCHKLGHFAKEYRQPKNQDSRNWNQDSSRRTVIVKDTYSNEMVAVDGAGFDWIFMADDEVPTNMALMAFLDFEPEFESCRPKSCEIESKNASADIPNKLKECPDAPLVKDRVLDNKDCSIKSSVVVEKKAVVPTIAKVKFVRPKQQKNSKETVRLTAITIKGKGWPRPVNTARPRPVNTARPNSAVVNSVIVNQVNAVKVTIVNGEEQIQALLDKKKEIITETSVRSDLHLEDAEGTECLPTAIIFEQLTLMRYENLTQKLTFYKAFFSPQ
nr:hypothetical protein [Tanacetum cinerariifolium]